MSKAIGVDIDGEVVWHARGVVSDHDTLCGLDSNDPDIGHNGTVEAKRGQKITCSTCYSIWKETVELGLRASNFDI